MDNAMKTEVIQLLTDERASIVRRAFCRENSSKAYLLNYIKGELTDLDKDKLDKLYAQYDNFIDYLQSQDF